MGYHKLPDLISDSRLTIFIGGNDTGKSTLIREIAERVDVSIIDADIGQSDIGPPSVVSLGVRQNGHYKMRDGYFCGSTTPARHFLQLLTGTARMARKVEKHPVLVNTTGLATGDIGRMLKTEKINALSPDLIVGIGGDELKYLDAFGHGGAKVLHLPVSPQVKIKSRQERASLRQEAFARHFAPARSMALPFERFSIERSLLFNGVQTKNKNGVLHLDISGREALAVFLTELSDTHSFMGELKVDVLHAYKPDDFVDLLVGLVDGQGNFAGLGIIESMDFDREEVRLYTPASNFSILQFGSIKLDPKNFIYKGAFTGLTFRA